MNGANPFSAVAEGYRRHRPGYPAALFEWLAQSAPGRGLAWDCGAGSGQASAGLARHFQRVVATDISGEQLARCHSGTSILPLRARAEAVPLATGSADLVTVAQALHWFALEPFHAEVRRVLRPGGVVAVWSYSLMSIDRAVDAIVQSLYGDTLGPYWDPARCLVENGYRELPFPFVPIEPPPFAMTACWELPQLLGYLGTWSALTHYRRATGRDPLSAVAERLAAIWADGTREVRWPLTLRMGRVD